MNKILIIIAVILLALGVTHFYITNKTNVEDPGDLTYHYITGYIYELSNKEMLVAEGISTNSYTGKTDDFIGTAIWVNVEEKTEIFKGEESISFSDLEVGTKVDVFVKGIVLESYPAQGTASKINVIEETATKECFVGGCSGELCSSDPDMISTCEFLSGMECISKGMSCELVNGSCDWVLSEEAAICLLEIEEEIGISVRETRIGYLFDKADLFFE